MTWVPYSPDWAPHVKGEFETRTIDPDTNSPDPMVPQKMRADCTKCGAHWEGSCMSGMVRSWINKFATLHIHRDPMTEPHFHKKAE